MNPLWCPFPNLRNASRLPLRDVDVCWLCRQYWWLWWGVWLCIFLYISVRVACVGAICRCCLHGHDCRWSVWRCEFPLSAAHRQSVRETNPLSISFALYATIVPAAFDGCLQDRDAGHHICAGCSARHILRKRYCSYVFPWSPSRGEHLFLLRCDFCSKIAWFQGKFRTFVPRLNDLTYNTKLVNLRET